MELTREQLQQNLKQLEANLANSYFEAGKVVGRVEGQINLLQQIIKLMPETPKPEQPAPDLKVAAPEPKA